MEVGLKEYFSEILYMIAMYKKTLWAIILGFVFFIGSHLTSNLQFSGPLKGLEVQLQANSLSATTKWLCSH